MKGLKKKYLKVFEKKKSKNKFFFTHFDYYKSWSSSGSRLESIICGSGFSENRSETLLFSTVLDFHVHLPFPYARLDFYVLVPAERRPDVNVPGHGLLFEKEVVDPGLDVGAEAGDG